MKTELEKCLAGEPFNGGDKVLADMTLNAKRLLKQLNETDYADTEQRKRIFHDLFGKMGEHVHIDIDFHCEYGKHIFIGDQVIINMNCTFVDNNRDRRQCIDSVQCTDIHSHPLYQITRKSRGGLGSRRRYMQNLCTPRENK